MIRTCSICRQAKSIDCFGTFHNGKNPNYIDTRCKECKNKSTKIHYSLKRETYLEKARIRDARRKCRKHGVSVDWLKAKMVEQNHTCAICHKQDTKRLSIDHNHTTNQVRGLLCQKCNFLIGLSQDSPEILTNAIAYLNQYNVMVTKDLYVVPA